MAKKKATTKTRGKASDRAARASNALTKGSAKGSKNGRTQRTISNERLRKLAKKHRPPDEYFFGDVQRP